MNNKWLPYTLTIACLALLTLLAACGAGGRTNETPAAPSVPTASSNDEVPAGNASAGEPVVIDNMGETIEFAAPPQRAVALNQHATEVMLALGLEDAMVGTAYLDDSILPEYKAQYDGIPVLSDQYPSKEVFLAADPDFAYAGWKSAFTEQTLGTRAELADQGIPTYVQESSNIARPTLDDVYRDILNIGRIFRVEDRAQRIVNDIGARLEDIQARIGVVDEPLDVFVYDSGEDKAFTAANTYLTSLIEMVGGRNIFADIDKGWAEVSWEEVVSRNPDVVVIVDYGSTTAEQKRELLLGNAALADVTAIREQRFIVLPLSAAAEGVRAPIALETLADGLYPDKTQP